jgi:hypothetical protein
MKRRKSWLERPKWSLWLQGFACRMVNRLRRQRLKPCPFCGQYPEIEYLADFACVKHVNTDCPISPVYGWDTSVWQHRRSPLTLAPGFDLEEVDDE